MKFPGFIGPSYVHRSVNVDAQRCINMYPDVNPPGTGKRGQVASLVGTPGLDLKVTLPESPVRALFRASTGTVFAIGGTKLYSIDSNWVATQLGTSINTDSGAVSMADNGTHLVFVDGTDGWVWNMDTSSFSEITDPDFFPADQVTFIDGYFVFNRKGTAQFFFSDLNSVDFDALDIGTAEGSPDDLTGLIANNQNLFLFGTQSTEVYYNSGATFPFERIQGAVLSIGCSAAFSIAKLDNQIYWLGGDETGTGIIYRMEGYQPQRISTPSIEDQIKDVSAANLALTRAWTYQQGGHTFYCFNIPTIDRTWCYDASTGLWHERSYQNNWGPERHRADCHSLAHGENIVGDYENGKIYALDLTKYTDDGDPIIRKRVAPILHDTEDMNHVFHHELRVDMETGVGLDGSGQGTDPKMMMRFSDDSGHKFGNERQGSIGKIGEYKVTSSWRRLGRARNRVYEVSISDPVKVVLVDAYIRFTKGVH